MRMFAPLALLVVFGLFHFASFGQTSASTAGSSSAGSSKNLILGLSEIKEGMHGKALTVFSGSKPEEFDVEIFGVVPGGIGPKQDLIVGRISGGNADRTAVFAGMSGSPVYINGKLIGAISYSFAFSKEAICGITPIEQMISIFEERSQTRSTANKPRAVSFAELAGTNWAAGLPTTPASSGIVSTSSSNSPLLAVAGQTFEPIATPLTFNGISQATLDLFAPQLRRAGLRPVASVGGSAEMTPMKKFDASTLNGGDSVSMQLTRGDISMAASGTVTMRDGERVYAFGHPFLGLGSSDLPMSESHVVAVIPNINNSFKLAVPDAMVGSMTQDRATGVFGKLGKAPAMIPVNLNVNTSRGGVEALKFEVARDELLTPLLLNIAITNALTAQERGLGDSTVTISGKVKIAGHEAVNIERRFAGSQASVMAAGSVVAPVGALIRSRFDDLNITGIDIDVSSTDGTNLATLERLSIDQSTVKAGQTVELRAFARAADGKIFVESLPVKIPADTPEGKLTITIGDGSQVQRDSALQQFVPRDLSELIGIINRVKSSDRLYAIATRASAGAVIGASELPNLPPSVLATLNNDRISGGIKPVVQTQVLETELPQSSQIITGSQSVTILVTR